jgi:hypothetical protein
MARAPLPSPAEALQQPLAPLPSWFLGLTCDRCSEDRMVNETHAGRWRDLRLDEILACTRYPWLPGGCRLC